MATSTHLHEWKQLGKGLVREVKDDHVPNGAAALAFYMVLALFPAAIFALSLLPYLPIPNLKDAIMDLVRQALPGSAADMLTGTVESVVSRRSGGLLSFGFLFSIWSASNGMYAVMQQLNVVNGVTERRSFVRAHAVALLLTLCFFVLVVGAHALVLFGGMLQSVRRRPPRLEWRAPRRLRLAALGHHHRRATARLRARLSPRTERPKTVRAGHSGQRLRDARAARRVLRFQALREQLRELRRGLRRPLER